MTTTTTKKHPCLPSTFSLEAALAEMQTWKQCPFKGCPVRFSPKRFDLNGIGLHLCGFHGVTLEEVMRTETPLIHVPNMCRLEDCPDKGNFAAPVHNLIFHDAGSAFNVRRTDVESVKRYPCPYCREEHESEFGFQDHLIVHVFLGHCKNEYPTTPSDWFVCGQPAVCHAARCHGRVFESTVAAQSHFQREHGVEAGLTALIGLDTSTLRTVLPVSPLKRRRDDDDETETETESECGQQCGPKVETIRAEDIRAAILALEKTVADLKSRLDGVDVAIQSL